MKQELKWVIGIRLGAKIVHKQMVETENPLKGIEKNLIFILK